MISVSDLPRFAARDFATDAVRIAHYVYPPLLFFWFVIAQTISVCTLANLKAKAKKRRRVLFLWIQLLVIVTYVGEAILMITHTLVEKGWWSSQDNVIYILASLLVWGVLEISLLDSEKAVWWPYYGSCVLTFFAETCLLGLSAKRGKLSNAFNSARLLVECIRVLILLLLPFMALVVSKWERSSEGSDEESARLLGDNTQTSYGSTSAQDTAEESPETREAKAKLLKKLEKSGNWWTYAKSFAIFWPLIWPKKEKWLQLSMVLVGFCLLAERGLNVLVPRQLGIVTNSLSDNNGAIPWLEVFLYVMFRWLASGAGVSALQRYLWVPIEQYSYRTITTAAYNHVMTLSYDFHSAKKTGELYQSVNQGRSVNGFVESILFLVLPMLTDLCVAFGYFFILFNSYMALTVAVVSVIYLWVTAKLGSMRNQMRRDFNKAARDESNIMYETMSSWTTVSYFNRIPHEQNRYSDAIKKFQRAERSWIVGLSILNAAQSMIFTMGLLVASFLAVYQVSQGEKPVGSFVTLLSYWAQLSGPLSFFANFYRKIQNQMLDAERLLELLQTVPSVTSKLGAKGLDHIDGEVVFEKVNFAYDIRKPAINDLNLHVPAGSTIALVGETGGGKSTCLKLLFRFYDVTSGAIKIDGIDIRDIELGSLRSHIGVVPQDSQMFNDTIMNNIKYANFEATDEEVHEACRAASIHDKISSFPDGYNSIVGERGVRLSGGELQRVAIARAIIKDSKIILLDEATSAVDMTTERKIQSAFKELSKNRTMFVVAHRLSTIMNADLIAVIKDGSLVELGNHEQLLELRGQYFQLWSKQLKNDSSDPDKTVVNDLSPKSRGEQLRKALTKTGARFHNKIFEDGGVRTGDAPPTTAMSCPQDRITPRQSQTAPTSNSAPQMSLHPTVTFNLGGDAPSPSMLAYRPFASPRNLVPAQGILKTSPKHSNSNQRSQLPVGRHSFSLKPDAKEFIPQNYTTVAVTSPGHSRLSIYGGHGASVHGHLVPPPLQERRVTPSTPSQAISIKFPWNSAESGHAGIKNIDGTGEEQGGIKEVQQIQERIDEALKSPKEMANGAATHVILGPQVPILSSISSEILDSKKEAQQQDDNKENESYRDTEADNESGMKKKRRRSRRRSHKAKSSDDIDQIIQQNGEDPSSNLPPMTVISPRPIEEGVNNAMNEEDLNAAGENTTEKRLKRRIRSASRSKSKLENEEPATIANSTEEKRGELKGRFKGKSFSSVSSGSGLDSPKTSESLLRSSSQGSLHRGRLNKAASSARAGSKKVENETKAELENGAGDK